LFPFPVRRSFVFLFHFRWFICLHYPCSSLLPFDSANHCGSVSLDSPSERARLSIAQSQ
jgi:hypothetical protein